jgi:hypothetical protein
MTDLSSTAGSGQAQAAHAASSKAWWLAALAALFAFRLAFGLSSEFFFEDETQIFLMGLRYYATGAWPHFGPDVVWTRSEIPGALQALLVGVPLRVLPVPEAPFFLLNLLSAGALAAFAWYVARRLPGIPRWLLWGWLFTIPWTLQFSTHVVNPSYVLAGAVIFFIGFFEAHPWFRIGAIRQTAAWFMMGFAVPWVAQFHMQWPLLLPFVGLVGLADLIGRRALPWRGVLAFLVGALLPAALIVPTWLTYGMSQGSGGVLDNLRIHAVNPFAMVTMLARFFSFASLEIARFIDIDGAKRLAFFERHVWLVPLAALAWIAGVVQPLWMLWAAVRAKAPHREWLALRLLLAVTVLLVYGSFWFVMEPAQAHNYYVVAPIAWMFTAYCWMLIDSHRWRRVAAVVLAVNIAFHAGLAWAQAPERSMYRNREPAAAAIRLKQPEMFGHRRAFAPEGGPAILQDSTRPYHPVRDLAVIDPGLRIGRFGLLQWSFMLENRNPRVAFRDVLYQMTYRDGKGRIVEQRHEFLKEIFQPGESGRLQVTDTFLRAPFSTAHFEILGAEALLPVEDR